MSEKPYPQDLLTQELLGLLTNNRSLPSKGIVKIVLRECPTWKERYGDWENRAIGLTIGRRLKRMMNSGLVYTTHFGGKQYLKESGI